MFRAALNRCLRTAGPASQAEKPNVVPGITNQLSTVSRLKQRASLRRWRDIFAYALTASTLAVFFPYSATNEYSLETKHWLGGSVALGLILIIAIHYWIGLRLNHLKYGLRFPPLPMAALLAGILYSAMAGLVSAN